MEIGKCAFCGNESPTSRWSGGIICVTFRNVACRRGEREFEINLKKGVKQ